MNWINSEKEPLYRLIRVAQEDREIHQQLTHILSLKSFHRKSALHSLIDQMKYSDAPDEIILAIKSLLEDENAEIAMKLIQQ